MSCSSGREGVGYEGDTCSFTCNTGYELIGSETVACQSNGSWSNITPICKQGTVMYVIPLKPNIHYIHFENLSFKS